MTFRTLYLHIGCHKTGTSAIQLWAHTNREALREAGVLYPLTGQWHDHSHHRFGFPLWRPDAADRRAALAPLLEELESERKASGCEDLLLSSELLERLPLSKPHREGLTEFLGALGGRVVAIVMLRRQDLFCESVFKQWVKDGAMRLAAPFSEWVEGQVPRCDYRALVDGWTALDAVERLIVQNNPFAEHPATRFIKLLPFDVAPGDGAGMGKIVNPTLDGRALEAKHFFNRMTLDETLDGKVLRALLGKGLNDGKLSLFDDGARETFLARFEKSNAAIVEQHALEEFESGVPKFDRTMRAVNGAALLEAVEAVAAQDRKVAARLMEEMRKAMVASAA